MFNEQTFDLANDIINLINTRKIKAGNIGYREVIDALHMVGVSAESVFNSDENKDLTEKENKNEKQ